MIQSPVSDIGYGGLDHSVYIVGIFYGREIFWYFLHENIVKYDEFICNYNIESKRVPEIKRLASNQFYYYLPANIRNQARIQVFWLEGRSSARSPARSRTEPGGEPGY